MFRPDFYLMLALGTALFLGCESEPAPTSADNDDKSAAVTTADAAPEARADAASDLEDGEEDAAPEARADTASDLEDGEEAATGAPAWTTSPGVEEDWNVPECATLEGIDETTGDTPELKSTDDFASFVKSVKKHASPSEDAENLWRLTIPSNPQMGANRKVTEQVRKLCSEWIGQPAPEIKEDREVAGDCSVQLAFGEQVAVLAHVTSCGADSCSADRFVWRADWTEPRKIDRPGNDSTIAVAPTLDELFFDQNINALDRHTFRGTIDGTSTCLLSKECFSPTLSPDGSFLLCRNMESDLLRVSTAGGAARLVDSADVAEDRTTRIRIQWGVFPRPARFLGPDRVAYEIHTEPRPTGGGDSSTKTVEVSIGTL